MKYLLITIFVMCGIWSAQAKDYKTTDDKTIGIAVNDSAYVVSWGGQSYTFLNTKMVMLIMDL